MTKLWPTGKPAAYDPDFSDPGGDSQYTVDKKTSDAVSQIFDEAGVSAGDGISVSVTNGDATVSLDAGALNQDIGFDADGARSIGSDEIRAAGVFTDEVNGTAIAADGRASTSAFGMGKTATNAQAAAMAATDAFLVPDNLDQALNLHFGTAHKLNNATYMAFRLNFWNDAGLLKHNVTGMITGGAAASNFVEKLSYASTTFNQTKNLGPSVGFNAGLGVASERIIFDVADAGSYANLASGLAKAIYCRCDDTSLSLPLSFRFDASYTDINGVTAYRPAIQVWDVTGSYVSLYSALSTGKALSLDVEGYFY